MATTILFQSPQGGTSIQGGTTSNLATLDVSNVKNLRITYKHRAGGGSLTATALLIHEAQGNNANITLATLHTVTVSNLQTFSRLHTSFVGRRLKIDVTASPTTNADNATETIILIVLGET